MSHDRQASLRAIQQLTRSVSRAGALEDLYEAALDALFEALGPDRASCLLFDDDDVMRFVAWRGLSDAYRAAVEGHTPWAPDSPEPQPIVVEDVESDPSVVDYREVFRAEGLGALAFVPLVHADRVIGKFMLYYDAPHRFDDEDLQLAGIIAGHVAFAVERTRTEHRLQVYREAFEHASDAIALVDQKGRYLEQNEAHRRLFGFDDPELIGTTPALLMNEETFAALWTDYTGRGRFRTEIVQRRSDGQERLVELTVYPVRGADDKIRVVGIQRDITARRRSEDALRFLARASAALDASLDHGATVGAIATLPVPELAAWGRVDLLVGERLRFGAGREDAGETEATAALAAGEPVVTDNGEGWTAAFPLVARGNTLGVLTVGGGAAHPRDDAAREVLAELARRSALALDNARLYRDVRDSDRRKDAFLAMLAHELRNPLFGMTTAVAVLRREPQMTAALDVFDRQARHITRLVDDLLDVSRITHGKIELQREPADLAEIVEHAAELVRPQVEERGHDLQLDLGPGLRVLADEVRMEQVFLNLLQNAVRYTPPGGRIEVMARADGAHAVVSVRDTGIGMDEGLRRSAFDLFLQGERGLDRSQGGLGIGLTLVRTLVELHDGSVEAHSDGPGQGSVLRVRMPVHAERVVQPASPASPVRHLPRKVLVVDDNEDAALVLAEALRTVGHQVRVAHAGPVALELVAEDVPEVVLLDIGLPGMDGYEVAKRLLSSAAPAPRLVALSGYGRRSDVDRSLQAGFAHHLVKPVDLATLEALIAGLR